MPAVPGSPRVHVCHGQWLLMGVWVTACGTPSPVEAPSAPAPFDQGEPSPYSFFSYERWRSLPSGPNGEHHLPNPQAVIFVEGETGVVTFLHDYGGESTGRLNPLPSSIEEVDSMVRDYKMNWESFVSGTPVSGLITTSIVPTADTPVTSLLALTDQGSSMNTSAPTELVLWQGGEGARLYFSRHSAMLLHEIYTEFASDGYPILIVNNQALWSCALTAPMDPSLIPAERLTPSLVACLPVDEREARYHVRVGVCVAPDTAWGAVLDTLKARMARVSELVLLFNCGDNPDGSLDLSVKYRARPPR